MKARAATWAPAAVSRNATADRDPILRPLSNARIFHRVRQFPSRR
ncbi:hypothetical protein ABIB17_003273 [Arthrobacter sp. UYEF6]